MHIFSFFQESSQLPPNAYNINTNNEFVSTTHVQAEPVQTPPPFLSGVPMVNPGNYAPSNNSEKLPLNQDMSQQLPHTSLPFTQQSLAQQATPQHHSVVSNMAAYSSSKLYNTS